jgi:LAO/AO transport system kinase
MTWYPMTSKIPGKGLALAEKIVKGDVRATAKLIRRIDDRDPGVFSELRALYAYAGRSHVVGFTGTPGVGKSTLVDRIVAKFRRDKKTVGIIAVDPTSPFTGGAILGDRVRMQQHALDEGVFIRSMATRGAFGGLTRSTADAILVLEAMGKDVIIVETVGVGQDEVDIVHNAQTTVVVTVPGMGDDIQAIKAGLMEIGDLFVVNKSDREGALKTVRDLRFMLETSSDRFKCAGWTPQVIQTVATEDSGIEELYQALQDHRRHLESGGGEGLSKIQTDRITRQLLDLLKEHLMERALVKLGGQDALKGIVQEIVAKKKDPYGACFELVEKLIGGTPT